MNTKPILVILIASALLILGTAFAHEEMQAPEDVIKTIMARQGVADVAQLDCTEISDDDFEFLGDTVMEKMVGSHELHEQMDAMMGGEGSASLRSMHIAMGKNWLGCHEGMEMGGMMGSSIMPVMMRMMGAYYPAYYSGFDAVLLLAIVGWVLFIVTIIYFLTRKKRRR